jgi:FlaA1/EpsC-like NDP-sugar epimerase
MDPRRRAVLVMEGAIAYVAVYAAAVIRYRTPVRHLGLLQRDLGPLWPRAGMFAVIVVLCLLAFGLYSARQRAQLSGVLVRLGAALVVATCALAAVFYLLPSLQMWRGVEALAVLITGIGLVIARLVLRAASQ